MKWAGLVKSLGTLLATDATLTSVVDASNVVLSGQRAHVVPSVEITVVSDTQNEIDEPVLIQFDVFTHTLAQLDTVETRIRQIATSDLPMAIGGETMWALFAGGRALPGPDDGVVSRSFDVSYRLIRHPAEHL